MVINGNLALAGGWKTGHVVSYQQKQFEITGADGCIATLRVLAENERVKEYFVFCEMYFPHSFQFEYA
jgi:hypothetical protein